MAISAQRGKAPSNVDVPKATTHSFHLLLSSPDCQLIRSLADTLIRVARCCPYVCFLLIPPRGMACGTVCLKPLSLPCMEGRDKTKQKTAMKIAVREEAVITGGIWVPFPSERRLLRHFNATPKKVAFSYDTDIPVTGVPVNSLKDLIDWLASKPGSCLFKFYLPAGCEAVESWCTQLPGNSKVR